MKSFLVILLSLFLFVNGCTPVKKELSVSSEDSFSSVNDLVQINSADIPAYSGRAYTIINDNVPYFSDEEYAVSSFSWYGELDDLGRCTGAYVVVSVDTMPTEPRGSIGMIRPSGWHTVRYDDLIEDRYLYNRCHLIAYQLSGENANERNLITGTRYMNIQGMEPFEQKTADYIKSTHNHVLYRVMPLFEGDNLLASGVFMEAASAEDKGEGLSFNVFCYNVQPGIDISYTDGSSRRMETEISETVYIGNANTMRFHYPDCKSVSEMAEHNKVYLTSREEAVNEGYIPCHLCNP